MISFKYKREAITQLDKNIPTSKNPSKYWATTSKSKENPTE